MQFKGFQEQGPKSRRGSVGLSTYNPADTDINKQQHKQQMLQNINDYLLAGGYFRARIKGITPFDKILGGMCWSITGCNVNVEIQFKDDLNLHQKIKLSQNVVRALASMECPFSLHPHQIQGLDFQNILPVIQWLVKKLNESRDDRNLLTKRQAQHYYKRQVQPLKITKLAQSQIMSRKAQKSNIMGKFAPKRKFKLKNINALSITQPKRVTAVLKQYDDVGSFISKIVNQRRQKEAQSRKDILKKMQAQGLSADFLVRARTSGMRQPMDLDSQLLGGQDSDYGMIFESAVESGQSNSSMNQLAHSATQSVNKIGAESKLANNPFLQKNGNAQRIKAAGGKDSGNNYYDQEDEMLMIGDGYFDEQDLKITKIHTGNKQNQSKAMKSASSQQGAQKVKMQDSSQNQNLDFDADENYPNFDEDQLNAIETRRSNSIVRGANISAALLDHIGQIQEKITDFSQKQTQLQQSDPTFILKQQQERFNNQIFALNQQVNQRLESVNQLQEQNEELESAITETQKKHFTVNDKLTKLQAAFEQIERQIDSKKGTNTQIISELVGKQNTLKEQRSKMKRKYREQKQKLEKDLQTAKRRQNKINAQQNKEALQQIDEDYEKQYQVLIDQRKIVAEKNKKITVLQRKIENTPSKIQLTQYQKRFRELYDLLNGKLEENKRYINLFNSLDETEKMLIKQSQYMKEIREGFRKSKNKKQKEQLLSDVKGLLGVISKASSDTVDKLKQLKTKKEQMQAEYNSSLEQERMYYEKIKVFQEECNRNDELSQRLEAVQNKG